MNGWLSSVFHQPQPPSSCWKSYSRSRPAFTFFCSAAGSILLLICSSFKACDTITLGRKLDMVCSVQPYGKLVRNSGAPKIVPATDGVTLICSIREDGTLASGDVTSTSRSPDAPAIVPACAFESFTPYGMIGS